MSRSGLPRFSLDLLRAFRAAACHLSFTAAARELSITQSAVSQGVKALEDQLGTPLFTRANRTLRLTQAGERLYRATDDALALIDEAATELANAGSALSITTTVPLASMWLGPRLPHFAQSHPDIRLRLVASNDNLDIAREGIDVAIRYVPAGSSPPRGEPIFHCEAFPVCSPTLLQSMRPSPASALDLTRHMLLDLETLRSGRPWYDWQQWLDAMHIKRFHAVKSLRFSHYDQVIAAAVSGCGIAIGKWPHLATHLAHDMLANPLGGAGVARIGTFYFIQAENEATGSVGRFLEWLRAEVREMSQEFPGSRTPPMKRAKRRSARR